MTTRRPNMVRRGQGGPEFEINVSPRVIVGIIVLLLVALWVVRGGPAYTVQADEEALVLTFGKYTRSSPPGLHFKWPWPIQDVIKVKVTEVKRLEIGLRSHGYGDKAQYTTFAEDRSLLQEAQMLTGDENVVNVSMVVQYRIRDAQVHSFNYRSPEEAENALRNVAEAALRQAVGDHPIDNVLTVGKFEVQNEIRDTMQTVADLYELGVAIGEVQLQDVQPPQAVVAAFKDVATAREEREKIINEARAYQRERIPHAEGEAERKRQEAQGYKQARIAEAEGAVARFVALARQHDTAPEITRARLYLETMFELLPKVRLTVVDESVGMVNVRSLNRTPAPEVVPLPAEQLGEGRPLGQAARSGQ